MATITAYGLEIPQRALSLEGFREWMASMGESAPRMCFSAGRLHIEMSPQDFRTHAPLVDAINDALAAITVSNDLGMYFRPPAWFTHEPTALSTEPDGFLVRWRSVEDGEIRINPERSSELLGRPDMVLEVVSKSSRKKDTIELVDDYSVAGISEYWIADALGAVPELQILTLEAGSYKRVAIKPDGWIDSSVFGSAFRLLRVTNRVGWPAYRLETRR